MKKLIIVCAALALATPAIGQITTASNSNATQLGTALQGPGVTFSSATLTTNTENGTFSNGTAATGIASGVVLTTGTLSCVTAVANGPSCTGGGSSSQLVLGFTATSAELFFNYVFASEEYNEFVGSQFNDAFSLVLNGTNYANVNLAQIPSLGGPVTINNVNNGSNSGYFVDNTGGIRPFSFDGLTTVLTAAADNLVIGNAYTLSFNIADVGDSNLDSAVFIQGGSVGVVTPPNNGVPEPATWAMMLMGFGLIGAAMRRRQKTVSDTRIAAYSC